MKSLEKMSTLLDQRLTRACAAFALETLSVHGWLAGGVSSSSSPVSSFLKKKELKMWKRGCGRKAGQTLHCALAVSHGAP